MPRAAPTWWSASPSATAGPRTEEMLDGLEVVPRARVRTGAGRSRRWTSTRSSRAARRWRSSTSSPTRNVPGGRNPKRWQDIEELLAAGIDVVIDLNIQHLESLNDVVEKITGVPQHETVPDEIVRRAHQVELVDMPPEALRRRMAHGNIYAPDKVDAALAELLPARQPHRAARAGAAVGGRPGRRGPPGVPHRARHRRCVGDAGTGRGRADRRPGGRHADPAGRPDRRPVGRRRPAGRPRRPQRRPRRRLARRAGRQRRAGGGPRRHLPLRRRRRRRPPRCWTSPAPRTPPSSSSARSRRGRLAALPDRAGHRRDDRDRAVRATSTSTWSPTSAARPRHACCPSRRRTPVHGPADRGAGGRYWCCRCCSRSSSPRHAARST